MTCRECGAKLHERDRRADGSYRCPDCGAVLRPKSHEGKGHPQKRHRDGEINVPEPPVDLFSTEPDVSSTPVGSAAQPGGSDGVHSEPDIPTDLDGDERGAETHAQPEAAAETDISELTGDALFEVDPSIPDVHSAPDKHKDRAKRRDGKKSHKRGGAPFGLMIALLILALVLLIMIFMLVRRGSGDSVHTAMNGTSLQNYTAEVPTASRTVSPAPTSIPSPAPSPTPTPVPTPTPTAEPTPISVHFRAVGDVMVHDAQLDYANQGNGVYDFTPQFQFVKDALSKADYTIANLELTISTSGHYAGYPTFWSPESVLDALKDCGIDLFTTANNHILDGFFDGIVKTNDELDERGFAHLGSYRSQQEADTPLVVDIKGIKVGFLAYTEHVNGNQRTVTADKSFCVKPLIGADFKADVQALRDLGAELVICLPHWGTENSRSVNATCRQLALDMADAGVDVILGSHPHVVQTMGMLEREVDGKQKQVLIAFSMGNFIANMQQRYRNNGIIVDFTVTRDPDGTISIHDPGYVPVYVYRRGRGLTVVCSLEYYNEQPEGMGDDAYTMLRQSVDDVAKLIDQEGIARLVN